MASTTYAHGCFLDLTKTYHLGNVTVMVRNAGQLPQPFWLGAACGGGAFFFARAVRSPADACHTMGRMQRRPGSLACI